MQESEETMMHNPVDDGQECDEESTSDTQKSSQPDVPSDAPDSPIDDTTSK